MRIAIANDHAGLELKKEIAEGLAKLGHRVEDFGTHDNSSVDYPDFATRVAKAVRDGQVDAGVLVCGTGIGMSIVANKYRGVRAALCTTEFEARMARQHNDANVLCMGERVVGPGLGRAIAEAFVGTQFEGGRHLKRVQKIADAEREADGLK
ncbi:MAG TPA: ribose 5-phosphate isomerase B [Myxococcales bacterium]|jgi:ribose 5-phosphate isomerase B|nr:ribose 5-phosphate isomerase B [Myxococcales bacterium]